MELSGQSIHFVTRPEFVSRARAQRLAARLAARLESGQPASGGIAVWGLGGAIGQLRRGNLLAGRERLERRGVRQISEIAFLRATGVLPPLPPSARSIAGAEFLRLAKLDEETVWTLSVTGAFEPEGGLFPFRDLKLARDIARLLDQGYQLGGLAEAAARSRRHAGTRIEASGSEIEVRLDEARIETTGQTLLPLDWAASPLNDVLDQAELAEQQEDFAEARRLYRIAAMATPADAVVRYNLGCMLTRLSEPGEAELQFRIAAALDPSLAEASFNAAHIRRMKGDAAGERRFLEQALAADPDYLDAMICLARLLIAEDAHGELRGLLDRIVRTGVPPAQEEFVRKASLLCRLAGYGP